VLGRIVRERIRVTAAPEPAPVFPGTTAGAVRYIRFTIAKKQPMLTSVNPKLPMRDKTRTKEFYLNGLEFQESSSDDFDGYLMVQKDAVQIHFFAFEALDPEENYGQVYIRTDAIEALYQSLLDKKVSIHPAGALQLKPWGQKEFSLLDPDNNLLTFGQGV